MLGAPQNFDTGRTSDKQLKKLNNRHMTLMAGVNYQRVTDWGIVRTTLAGDTLGNSKGYQWDIGWLYRFQMGRFGVMPDGA